MDLADLTDYNLLHFLSLQALFSLQNLQVLNLSDNELTIIPSAISNLVNLREVNFSKNGMLFVSISFQSDRDITPQNAIISHKRVYFTTGIIDLPENIKNCKNLQEIDASVNPIGKWVIDCNQHSLLCNPSILARLLM